MKLINAVNANRASSNKACNVAISCTLALLLVVLGLSSLTGCAPKSNNPNDKGLTGGVAATVNGTDIEEDKVTRYINSIRNSGNYEEDDAWAKYLSEQKKTPESLREDTLDTFIDQELVKQFADDEGAGATDEKIDEVVANMRANYSSDKAWETALEGAGFESEDDYREALDFSITYKNLENILNERYITGDEKLKASAFEKFKSYDGAKKSSHILFDLEDQETAQDVLSQLQEGTIDFDAAAREYSKDSSSTKGGDVGWDKLTTFVDEYQTALDGLDEGEMSELVESEYGYHIIMCTGIYTAPESLDSFEGIPEEIVENVTSSVLSDDEKAYNEAHPEAADDSAADSAGAADGDGADGESADEEDEDDGYKTPMETWLKEKRDSSEVTINPMPDNVPYNVDMDAYESKAEQESIDASAAANATADIASTENAVDLAETENGAGTADAGASSAASGAAE